MIILLENHKRQIIEGSPFNVPYVLVQGVRSYPTPLGSRQALVVEPAW